MSPKSSNRALLDTSRSMPALLLTEKEVEGLLRMDDALVAVEEGLRAMGRGEATNRPRQRVGTRETAVNVMLASWPARGYAGFKYYTASRAGIRFWVHLFDMATGELLAVIQADRLGQQRTGAASGVATKYLARADASTVGIVGTGWQAESQLEAVCAVRSIRRLRCFGRADETGGDHMGPRPRDQRSRRGQSPGADERRRHHVVQIPWNRDGGRRRGCARVRARTRPGNRQVDLPLTTHRRVDIRNPRPHRLGSGSIHQPMPQGSVSRRRSRYRLTGLKKMKTTGRTR